MAALDSFQEANQLLSNTLRELEAAMQQGRPCYISASPPAIKTRYHQSDLTAMTRPEDFANGNTGHDQVDLAEPNNNLNRPCSDPSTTWEREKDTNSMGSANTSSNEELPVSDNASSVSSGVTLEKLVKAIETDKLPAPDSKVRFTILKWIYDNNGDETLRNLLTNTQRSGPGPGPAGNGARTRIVNTRSCRSSSTLTNGSTKAIRPYQTQFSDSGFGSTLSSGSSCSFLPPPPPYRPNPEQEHAPHHANSLSPPKQIVLSPNAIRIGGGPLPAELLAQDEAQQHQPPQPLKQHEDAEDPHEHRIHRSFSDSKYGLVPQQQRLLIKRGSSARTSPMNSSVTLAINNHPTGICSVDPAERRGSSWTHSRSSLSPSPSMSTVSCPEYPELQEKLRRLAITRDTLSLQVAVLHDQVGAQKEKIRDLESLLADKRRIYSYEVLTNNINELKHRFTAMEKEKTEAEQRLQASQAEIERLNHSIQTLMTQHTSNMVKSDKTEDAEMEHLRVIVQKLMADNEQKKAEIHALRSQLGDHQQQRPSENGQRARPSPSSSPFQLQQQQQQQLQQQQPVDINQQIRRLLFDDLKENLAHSSSFPASLCSTVHHPAFARAAGPIPPSTSYLSSLSAGGQPLSEPVAWQPVPQPARPLHHTTSMYAQPSGAGFAPSSPAARQLAAELDELRRINGELQLQHQHQFSQSNSLPRTLHTKSVSSLNLPRPRLSATSSTHIGGEFPPPDHPRRLAQSRLAKSTPNLAPKRWSGACSDSESEEDLRRCRLQAGGEEGGRLKRGRTRSTLRNLFGRLTRSSSQEMRPRSAQPPPPPPRPLRASASARAAGLAVVPLRPAARVFCEWPRETVCAWLAAAGLPDLVPEAQRRVRTGRFLLNLSAADMEKELRLTPHLRRKRLRCLLDAIDRNHANLPEPADNMDTHQVMLWLDEIGLPQYREVFAENLVDGQMLLCLTAQDLVEMRITSAMHHATLARGIQFLRTVDFGLHRLEKSFHAEVLQRAQAPEDVEKWAHGCVVQWLKNIDLAEFTPNLMFSGVHGALMVHEPTFTAESLAEALQIPVHKTLLRRHLTTHFNKLIGSEIITHKRDVLTQPNVTYLSPTLRIKLMKRGFTLGRKKGKNEVYVEPDVQVCPGPSPFQLSSSRSVNSFETTSNV